MSAYTETGFLKVELQVSIIGPMQKNQASKIEHDLMMFFEERKLNINGKISYVNINSFEVEKNYNRLDTST